MPAADSMEAEMDGDGCLGEWIPTNAFASGEHFLGSMENAAECVAKAKTACYPEYDLANIQASAVGTGSATGCWCQKSNGATISTQYQEGAGYWTCRVKY